MIPDWSRLAPNRPLNPGDAAYVPRTIGAPRIADWILTGRSPLLVVGPVGVGKSTELAFAEQTLKAPLRLVCRIPLDRTENMRTLTAERVLLRIAQHIGTIAQIRGIPFAANLQSEIHAASTNPLSPEGSPSSRSAEDLAALVIVGMRGSNAQFRITLIIDGLEKTPPAPAQLIFDALQRLCTRTALEVVVVVPWHAAYGPGAESVMVPGEKLVVVPPIDVEGPNALQGIEFLRSVAVRRLHLAGEALVQFTGRIGEPMGVLDLCARLSGGIPRSFLQLLADAASYARVNNGEDWPGTAHVAQAVADQRDSFRRLLTPGDDAALGAVDGTDGRNMPLEQKLRMLSHGVLLERHEGGQPIMRPHPIVRDLL